MRLVTAVLAFAMLGVASAAAAMSGSEARDLALAVNLTQSDMQGYDASRTSPQDTLSADRNFTRCARIVPAAQAVADVPSKTFARTTDTGFESVYSEVVVLKSAALVERDMKKLRTSRARKCMVKALRKEIGKSLVRLSVTALKPAVPNGAGLRIKSVVRVKDQAVPVFIDFLFVGHEDAEAGIVVAAGPHAPQRDQENGLLDTVESRLVAEQNKDTIF